MKMDNKGKFCRFSKSGGCSKSIDFTDFSLSLLEYSNAILDQCENEMGGRKSVWYLLRFERGV